ncbi:MAG: DUF1840 domain-containing protein [Polaromonas sp.]|nr:DUF1840 domain-containing protein [Polaromonas sp.]
MLYRFKSQATADTVMLQATGEQLLTIMGKTVAPQGIITVAQMPAAIAALNQAVLDSEALGDDAAAPTATTKEDEAAPTDPIRLRQRVAPLVAMLKECAAAGKDVVWGV